MMKIINKESTDVFSAVGKLNKYANGKSLFCIEKMKKR